MKPYKLSTGTGRRWTKFLMFFALALITVVVGGIIAVNQIYKHNLTPVDGLADESITFTVATGSYPGKVAAELKEKKLIRSSRAFLQYAKSQQLDAEFKAGTYRLSQSMSVQTIVRVLTDGDTAEDLFTIYPGNNINQIKQLMRDRTHFSETEIEEAFNPQNYLDHPLSADIPKGASLEGFIFPDSYQFVVGTTAKTIIRQALDEMSEALTPEVRASFESQGLNVYEALTLASIVEREVGDRDISGRLNDNRAKAAQVFLKRLEIGMMLQSNATDGYPEAYDTYTIAGLPPGPISSVSFSSLKALANPAETNFLYFVAGKDCLTRFSETQEQHEIYKEAHGIAAPEDGCRG